MAAKATENGRRKSAGAKSPAPPTTITLRVSPDKLKAIVEKTTPAKEETPAKDTPKADEESNAEGKDTTAKNSPAPSSTAAVAADGAENTSEANSATPAVNEDGTPAAAAMAPPEEGAKKKGTKRSAGAANGVGPDGQPKAKGKPGPKKKARLEDGTVDPKSGGHRLGPKANQGAINAHLRALDRSGKPCRKWDRGGFKVKSFTGIEWEIPRWTAPPKIVAQPPSDETTPADASAANSSKENKEPSGENGIKSDVNSAAPDSTANSASGGVEGPSAPGSAIAASSPAPVPVSAAS